MKRGGAAGKSDGVLHACLLGRDLLHLIDVLAYGAHPVGFISLRDKLKLFPMHRRRCKPYLFLKSLELATSRKSHVILSLAFPVRPIPGCRITLLLLPDPACESSPAPSREVWHLRPSHQQDASAASRFPRGFVPG